jgi:hypothetical protein
MPAKRDFFKHAVTTYFLSPVKVVSIAIGIVPYFKENVTATALPLGTSSKATAKLLIV